MIGSLMFVGVVGGVLAYGFNHANKLEAKKKAEMDNYRREVEARPRKEEAANKRMIDCATRICKFIETTGVIEDVSYASIASHRFKYETFQREWEAVYTGKDSNLYNQVMRAFRYYDAEIMFADFFATTFHMKELDKTLVKLSENYRGGLKGRDDVIFANEEKVTSMIERATSIVEFMKSGEYDYSDHSDRIAMMSVKLNQFIGEMQYNPIKVNRE